MSDNKTVKLVDANTLIKKMKTCSESEEFDRNTALTCVRQAPEIINCNLLALYPFNLAFDVFQDEEQALEICVPKLLETLQTLTPRETSFIQLRYAQGKTLAEIGELTELTHERVRQVIAKAISLLRHPSRCNRFKSVSLLELNVCERKLVTANEKAQQLAEENEKLAANIVPDRMLPLMKMSLKSENPLPGYVNIEELELSVRASNCLSRHNIKVVGDLINMTERDLLKIRCLGAGTATEIISTLSKYGLHLKSNDE